MISDNIIEKAERFIDELFDGNSDGHDACHSLRVYRNALAIASAYPECDITAVSLAALLHDADDHKLFDTDGFANARSFLAENGITGEYAELIIKVIGSVSFSANRGNTPDTIEAEIVQDADRLDAIGAVGIARTFAYGGSHGRKLEQSAEHFREKLLLLKDEMNTPEAKAIAEERHAFTEAFLERFISEISIE